MKRILVTGANGFVGRMLCKVLQEKGHTVRGAVRSDCKKSSGSVTKLKCAPIEDIVAVGDIGPSTDWSKALVGVDIVVHLAARVHIMQEISKNPLESFRIVNAHGVERFARMAADYRIKRFVNISSISIHGNSTGERPYLEDDDAQPQSPYAISKWEGELALRQIASESNFEPVVVRPPLVYGPGVGGNFLRLMQLADRGLPLPLGSVENKRSFIGIENLVDLIVSCVVHPAAAGETFLVADGEDLSTPDLIRRVAKLLGRPARIVPFPVSVMRAAAKMLKKEDVLDRLCNCLQVDASKARRILGWQPSVPLDEGLAQTVRWYLKEYKSRGVI